MVNGDVMYPDPFVSRSVPRMGNRDKSQDNTSKANGVRAVQSAVIESATEIIHHKCIVIIMVTDTGNVDSKY